MTQSLPALIPLLFLLAGCETSRELIPSGSEGSAGNGPQARVNLVVGKEISLPLIQGTVRVDDVQDSRCPTGVVCVWEGDAAVSLTLKNPAGTERRNIILHTSPSVGPREISVSGYRFVLVSVSPYPAGGRPVGIDEYLIVIEILPPGNTL